MDQEALETRLDFEVERFGPSRNYPGSYAQINLELQDDLWADTLEVLGQIGPSLLALKMKACWWAQSWTLPTRFRPRLAPS
jgi:hypothetical protein